MSKAQMTNLQLRQTGYRGLIPFHVLLDLSLCVNSVRMYGLIEQMESRPGATGVMFTNRYLSNILGITIRQVQKITSKLKDAGYIVRLEISKGQWLWSTQKNPPIQEMEDENEACNETAPHELPLHPPMNSEFTPPMNSEFTHNIQNINTQKTNTNTTTTITTRDINNIPRARENSEVSGGDDEVIDRESGEVVVSGGCIISEEVDKELIVFNRGLVMHAKDNREFLFWCKYTLDNTIKVSGMEEKLKVLKSWLKKGGLKKPIGYGEPKPQPKYASERDRFSQQATSGAAYTMVARQAEERRTAEQEANSRQIAEEAIAEIKSKLGSCFKRVNQDE